MLDLRLVTFPDAQRYQIILLGDRAEWCELAQSRYATAPQLKLEPATSSFYCKFLIAETYKVRRKMNVVGAEQRHVTSVT